MSKRIWLILAAIALVAAFAGAYGVLALARRDTPPPVGFSATPNNSTPTTEASPDLDGDWRVVALNSFVGYRVRERLTDLPAPNDAVGRTSAVEGTLHIAGLVVDLVDVSADLRQLKSDENRRDNRIRRSGLESNKFPTARFVLAAPMSFEAKPEAGREVATTASGKLTLHGVTRDVSVPIKARWSSDRIEVVGSLEILMDDYDITPPKFGPVLSIEDKGTMEFQLVFSR